MDMQALINGMSQRWKEERAETQMTLGKLIDHLSALPADFLIEGIGNPDSYRGYYSDLAFDYVRDRVTAAELLETCKKCMGEVFHGYKGGDYVMGRLAPLWIASYGSCGKKLLDIDADGNLVLGEDD